MHLTKNQLANYLIGYQSSNSSKTIGRGTFGKVKLAKHTKTGQPVAIKILEKDKIKDVTDVERVSRELHILKITQHSSIAQMYEVIETVKNIFIIMEYAPNGEFFDYVMDAKIKNEQEAHHYFVQMVAGLEYMHKLKISHRDVKPENMLLDHNKRLKMVDFGLSNMYKEGEKLLTACGSPCYASPEMIKGQEYDPQLTDVWSLGVVLFSMIFAKLPFEDDNTSVLYGKIKSGLYVIDKRISAQLKDLLSKMLSTKPKKRINLAQIKQHPWYLKEKGPKCNGVMVGYENVPLDEKIISHLETLGYDSASCRKYLQNNIRNDVTTAYYLIMKRNFIMGNPSPYDLCGEAFQKKSLMPKKSKINIKSQSADCRYSTPRKDTIQFEQQIHPFNHIEIKNPILKTKANESLKKYKNFNESMMRKERNCISQMKSEQYQKGFKTKASFYATNNRYGQTHGTSLNKSLKRHRDSRKGMTTDGRDSQSKQKLHISHNPNTSLSRRKDIQKQHNISINVYINNAKIQTPSLVGKRLSKDKQSNKRIEKELSMYASNKSRKNVAGYFVLKNQRHDRGSNKRLKTETYQREQPKRQSRRYNDDHEHQLSQVECRSLQKSNQISLFEGGFWKKKSMNPRAKDREHTTDTRLGARNPNLFRRN